jgi:hypothetical protein
MMIGPLAQAASTDEAQGHQGILEPIHSAPPGVVLTQKEHQILAAGRHVERHSKTDSGGSGIAVQYIEASSADIWATILSYHRYKGWVKNVVDCSVYRTDGNVLYVDMKTSILGFKSRIFTKNTVRKDLGYMAWSLDYDRKSDVNDLVGYWRVEPVSDLPGFTKLEHSNSVFIKGVPGFLVNYMTRDALSDGTSWVKREAEKRSARSTGH